MGLNVGRPTGFPGFLLDEGPGFGTFGHAAKRHIDRRDTAGTASGARWLGGRAAFLRRGGAMGGRGPGRSPIGWR